MNKKCLSVFSAAVFAVFAWFTRACGEDLLKGPWEESEIIHEEKNIDITYDSMGKQVGVALLVMYQKMVSPQLNTNCQFYPSCSNYAKQSVIKYGFFKGCIMGIERFMRCNRWAKNYYYPLVKTGSGWRRKDLPEDNILKK